MANYNVKWIKSTKGNDQLVVDDYIYHCNGKGKAGAVKYWICSTPGCRVNAKTQGNNLLSLTGIVNPPDHGHANNSELISDLKLKVCLALV